VPEPGDTGTPPRVFVSFAREPAEHRAAVGAFAGFLRTGAGIDARIEEWLPPQRRDRVAWAVREFAAADYVVVVASPAYKRVLDDAAAGEPGDLTHFEAGLIRDTLARGPAEELRRILPVVLPGGSRGDVPEVLRPYATKSFLVPEISLAGLRELLHVIAGVPLHPLPPLGSYFPPLPPGRSLVVAGPPAEPDGVLAAGAETKIGDDVYLVHGEPGSEPVADHAAVRYQGRALRLGRPHEHVWLRRVVLRHDTPAARAEIAALEREHDLLARLRDRGLPGRSRLVADDRVATLVTPWPSAGGEPCGTLAEFVPRPGEAVDPWHAVVLLRGLGGLGRPLSALHAAGVVHGALTPAGVYRLDERVFAVRDLGDAARDVRAGAGPVDYRAPEQERRGRGGVGPWTDVFRLAALACHLTTGHLPAPGTPLPVHAFAPWAPPRAAAAVDAALAPDAARRPGMAELAAALRS
jgi:hypothetical protein